MHLAECISHPGPVRRESQPESSRMFYAVHYDCCKQKKEHSSYAKGKEKGIPGALLAYCSYLGEPY